jgi:hypothetical protein
LLVHTIPESPEAPDESFVSIDHDTIPGTTNGVVAVLQYAALRKTSSSRNNETPITVLPFIDCEATSE